MQVQSRLPPGLPQHPPLDPQAQTQHPHPTLHHPLSRPDYSSPSTNHNSLPSRPSPMQPYHPHQQQQYAAGSQSSPLQQQHQQQHQQQQQHPQQRHQQSNQLPPMYPSMNLSPIPMSTQSGPSMQGPGAVPQAAMYHPGAMGASSLPPPTLSNPPPKHQSHTAEKKLFVTGSNGKYNFELKVEQQPSRARMCGFGDKDRRPITPPPCIKLVITDMAGMPVSAEDIGHDGNMFVLIVDLWDDHAVREVNLVRSSSTSPAASISNASLTSYPPVPERQPQAHDYPGMMMTGPVQPLYQIGTAGGQPMYQHAPPTYPGLAGAHYPNGPYGYSMSAMPSPAAPQAHHYQGFNSTASYQHSSGMHTRNLIGSNSVNASLLKDLDGQEGFWFVLQDLSVRTEGFFRLKLNFIDVSSIDGDNSLNKGRSPVIASAFTDIFQVFSAKKFPGVIESTPLSKCFAGQGIKIPIRKDVKPERDDDDDY